MIAAAAFIGRLPVFYKRSDGCLAFATETRKMPQANLGSRASVYASRIRVPLPRHIAAPPDRRVKPPFTPAGSSGRFVDGLGQVERPAPASWTAGTALQDSVTGWAQPGHPDRAVADLAIPHSGLWCGGTPRIGAAWAPNAGSSSVTASLATRQDPKRFGLTMLWSRPHLGVLPETHRTLTGHSPDTHRRHTVDNFPPLFGGYWCKLLFSNAL